MWNLEYPLERIRSVLPDVVRVREGSDKIVSYRFPGDETEKVLPCFGIVFFLNFDHGQFPKDLCAISRAIRCLDKERALFIAGHMLGEEVWPNKKLASIAAIIPIDSKAAFHTDLMPHLDIPHPF
ncbi:MAG: hypothetical protein HYT22_01925 [Candidatus Niyogibacteria bacterium]|nr:hypothetical protein [Candidatus Niyogibacteria bacterium]